MSFFSALERAEQELARRRQTAPSEVASEVNPVFSRDSRRGLEQLKLLFAYSKFDIGLYTAVAITFTGAIAFEPAVFRFHRGLLGLAVFFTCLAGMAAGIVAHCQLRLGKLYCRTGQREQAQEHLTTATTMYREMGMTYWLEQTEAETRELR
jgi:hypothetical protein